MAVLTFPIPTQLKNLIEPAASADAATKYYVDSALSSGTGLGAVGSTTQVQFNNAGTMGASSNFTFDISTNILTVTGNIISTNANLGNLATANYVNVTSNLKSGNASLGNLVTANYFTGTLTTALQPNITTVGTLGNLLVTSNITGSNLTVTTSATLGNLVVSTTANLGAVGNVTITGGTAGQFLTSNGSGGLSFTTLSATSISNGNSNVIVNTNSNVSISAVGVSNVITANGTIVTITPSTSATNTTTGALVVSGGLGVAGNIYGGNIISAATTLLRGNKNVPTFVSSATAPSNPMMGDEWYNTTNDVIYQYIYDGTTYNWIDVSTGFISANASALASTIVVRDGNGNIYGNTLSGNSLVISGTSNLGPVGNVTITGGTSGQYLQTNGSGVLTWSTISSTSLSNGTSNLSILNSGNVTISSAGTANVLVVSSTGANVAGTLNATGNANVGNIGSNNAVFTGTLNATGNANVGNIGASSGVFTGSLNVTGAIVSGDHTVTGNLIVTGTTEYVNVTTLAITDPIVEQGGGANKAALIANDSKDRGTLLHYYTTAPVDAFMGWDNSNAEFSFGSNVSVTGDIVTFNSLGNIRAGNANLGNLVYANYYSGNGSLLSSITGANVTGAVAFATTANAVAGANVSGQVANALVAGTVYTAAQPTITSVGTLTSLAVTGNTTSGNATLGNLTTSNYFSGNGSLLSSITGANVTGQVNFAATANAVAGANVSGAVAFATTANAVAGANVTGQVANALVSGTVYTNAQPAITSVGTLTSLAVTGNITSGNATLGNLVTANFYSGSGNLLSNIQGANVSGAVAFATTANAVAGGNVIGQVGNALIAGTVYTNAQPAITSVGTLTSLAVTGNITSGNATLGNVATANFFLGNGSLLTGIVASSGSANYANFAGNVVNASQPNITSTGTLTSLSVSGDAAFTGANISLGTVANLHVLGGAPASFLKTDGFGNLTWGAGGNIVGYASFMDIAKDSFIGDGSTRSFSLSVTPSNVNSLVVNLGGIIQQSSVYTLSGSVVSFASPVSNGQKLEITTYGIASLSGSNSQVQFNNDGVFGSSSAFTFDSGSNTLSTTTLAVTGTSISLNGAAISANSTSGSAGIFNFGPISNVNIGLTSNVTLGSSSGTVTTRGTLVANSISSNTVATSALVNNTVSITVQDDADYVIDSFNTTLYRTAKYIINAGNADGYQALEVLLIHDGSISFTTAYGSISTGLEQDIISITSTITGGVVNLYARGSKSNTKVNLIRTYVSD